MACSDPTDFLAILSDYLQRNGYHVGLDSGNLVTEREAKGTEIARSAVEVMLELSGLHGGPTGTKELTSDKVREALTPLVGNVDLFAWKTSQLIPVVISDGISAPDLQMCMDTFLKFGLRSANSLSVQKYGGYLHVYPLFVFAGAQADLTTLRDVTVSEREASFWLRVYVDAAVITLRDQKIAWVKGVKVPKELSGLNALLS